MSAPIARQGTVVRYTPAPRYEGDRQPRWCREGMAIADDRGRLVDTYWGSGGDAHVVTAAEAASVEVLFYLEDFDELDRWRPDVEKWRTYAPEDRQRVTMQHGLQQRLFIRKGAVPARETMIANARGKVAEAEDEVRSAQSTLRWAQEDLDALLAAPGDCVCRPSLCARTECPSCAPANDWQKCSALPARLGGAA
jgi:hypothetical protein